MLERELSHKRGEMEQKLQLRTEELALSKGWWAEEKKDREHNRNESRKLVELLIALYKKQD